MGTNYYWQADAAACETCGHVDESERLHIGKSSAGWTFALCVYPEKGIDGLAGWETRWTSGTIVDEDGDTITPAEMRERIADRTTREVDQSIAPHGYSSWTELLQRNHARLTPDGLLTGDGSYSRCGETIGTYQLCTPGFS